MDTKSTGKLSAFALEFKIKAGSLLQSLGGSALHNHYNISLVPMLPDCFSVSTMLHATMNVIIPTNLVCVLFDPAIPTSSLQLFLYLYIIFKPCHIIT